MRRSWIEGLAASLLALVFLGALASPLADAARPPIMPSDLRAQEVRAWAAALNLARATPEERRAWVRPPTERFYVQRFYPADGGACAGPLPPGQICAQRICGLTEIFLSPDEKGVLEWSSISMLFLKPDEGQYAEGLLTHEYLHTIWMARSIASVDFRHAAPDSEAWVRRLINATCPSE